MLSRIPSPLNGERDFPEHCAGCAPLNLHRKAPSPPAPLPSDGRGWPLGVCSQACPPPAKMIPERRARHAFQFLHVHLRFSSLHFVGVCASGAERPATIGHCLVSRRLRVFLWLGASGES